MTSMKGLTFQKEDQNHYITVTTSGKVQCRYQLYLLDFTSSSASN
jgi:hypothetical protein